MTVDNKRYDQSSNILTGVTGRQNPIKVIILYMKYVSQEFFVVFCKYLRILLDKSEQDTQNYADQGQRYLRLITLTEFCIILISSESRIQ